MRTSGILNGMRQPDRDSRSGLLKIAFAATVWGTIPLVVRYVDASPLVIVFWRVAISAAVMWLWLAFRGRVGELLRLPRRKKLALMAVGALLALNWSLFISAYKLADVAIVALLGYTGPVFVAALNHLFTGDPFDRRVLLPLGLALGGTIVIVNPARISLAGDQLLGAALAFGSALTYATLILTVKRVLANTPTSVVMVAENTTAAVLLLPAALLLKGPSEPSGYAALAVLALVHTVFTAVLFLGALRVVRADHAAILTYAEALSAVVFAALFLGEPITAAIAVGGALIVGAGVIVAGLQPTRGVEAPPGQLEAR